jgi:gluconolactonase
MTRCCVAIGLCLLVGGCAQHQVKPRVVATLPSYSEGIVFDAQGAAFVSVLNHETVFVVREPAPPVAWYRVTEPNGHKILPDGTHLIAARGGVQHVDAEGKLIEVLAPQLITPNDLALDGDGGVYVTVPAESEADREAGRSGVYYLDAHQAVHKVADDLCYPNGVVVRPDGKSLVVDDSCNRRIYEFQIQSPGVLTARRILVEVPDTRSIPDGMTLDHVGRIYMADYGTGTVRVFRSTGEAVREYPTGLEHASNVAFGGASLGTLYVTGSAHGEEKPGQLVVLPIGVRGRSPLALPASIRE